jgi:NOL1/NOP2/sun family putative RNA methylase
MIDLPAAYLSQMETLLGEDYPAFLASLEGQPKAGLRVNTLKLSTEKLSAIFPSGLSPIPWCASGFQIPAGAQPGRNPYHAAGLYYLQEPSAMATAEILAPQPGELVLDLSAAPGGKSTHLAALLQQQGLLVANEIHSGRAWELAENIERWGVRNAVILNETPERVAAHFGPIFDRVLLDAPCSGEGMFRKSHPARRDWSPELVRGCAARQAEILRQAARLVRPGGWLAYATCTFNPRENEQVIAAFLGETSLDGERSFSLIQAQSFPGFEPGKPEWAGASPHAAEMTKAVRLWPHRMSGEGHFIALMRHMGHEDRSASSTSHPTNMGKLFPLRVSGQPLRLFQDFILAELRPSAISFEIDHLAIVGSYLYDIPAGLPDLSGLKAIHPGWWLGVFKKDRFEPSHALAMGLTGEQARETLDLDGRSDEVLAYLRGEALPRAGQNGWVLVCVEDYPLGWGKRVNGVIKNLYPRGLRWMA